MKQIDQYAKLADFIADIDRTSTHLPFKIMGRRKFPDPKKSTSGTYHTVSMLSEVYKNIADPDSIPSFQSTPAPFGEILKVGCRLYGGSQTYCTQIVPNAKTGANVFQGDIVEFDSTSVLGAAQFPPHKLSLMISHSCAISNAAFVSVVPVFTESELILQTVTSLRGIQTQQTSLTSVRANWLGNEQPNFLGLPAESIAGINNGDRMVACLHLQTVVAKSRIPTSPKLRLTYRALSYLQMRLALLYMRDVQDSDDTREI